MRTLRRIRGWLGWFPVVPAGIILLVMAGCAGPQLPAYQRGTSCSAENVQSYAKAHNMTYEQALADLRKQDQQLWEQHEAQQKKQAAGSRQ